MITNNFSPLNAALGEGGHLRINLNQISPLPVEAIEFLDELSQRSSVEKLIIFGSRACGDYDKYSDIDLAVVASSFTKADWVMLRARAIHDVRVVFRISIVNFLSNPDCLQQRIYNDGEVIYEQPKKAIG
ncbi:nucleotidyltransferase domain-containing protein [Shewanella glacialimarina]|nr:nucleotidyltransferase domain-containing protein [Shewanella glacialimarina]